MGRLFPFACLLLWAAAGVSSSEGECSDRRLESTPAPALSLPTLPFLLTLQRSGSRPGITARCWRPRDSLASPLMVREPAALLLRCRPALPRCSLSTRPLAPQQTCRASHAPCGSATTR